MTIVEDIDQLRAKLQEALNTTGLECGLGSSANVYLMTDTQAGREYGVCFSLYVGLGMVKHPDPKEAAP
jgi:hypothetical protein